MTRFASFAASVLTLTVPSALFSQVLTLSPQTLTFPSSDPDTVPIVAAPPMQVGYVITGRGRGQSWTITVRAYGDLIAGPAQIPISNISWVATPSPPFRNGTLSSSVAQTLAAGTGETGRSTGSVTFRFVNSWDYAAANYTQTVVFTLSSP